MSESSPAASPQVTVVGSLRIAFDDRVLRPRAWTVAQSRWAADILADAPSGAVLELCAGAGHIGLCAVAGTDRRLVCVDLSPIACAYARLNAAAAGMAERVEVREGSMDAVLRDTERFPLVIADPPWVLRGDVTRYPGDPLEAIDGGDDGLDVARLCVEVALGHLTRNGVVILQVGTLDQADRLRDELEGRRLAMSEVRECERGVLVRLDLTGDADDRAAACGSRRTTAAGSTCCSGTRPSRVWSSRAAHPRHP